MGKGECPAGKGPFGVRPTVSQMSWRFHDALTYDLWKMRAERHAAVLRAATPGIVTDR